MLARARLVVGVACIAVAAALLLTKLPDVVRSTGSAADSYAPSAAPVDRLVKSGDILGINRDLQVHALASIPPGSTYALLLAGDPDTASRVYGIAPITAAVIGPFLNYLLLPSEAVDPSQARYIICWGCDTSRWDHRTTWLFGGPQGVAIGRVRGR